MTKKVSVYIPVLNEESRIESALKSLDWVDEIVIIDTGCTDETISIAERHTDRIVAHEFVGFGQLRNFGIDACSNEWIISIDADERCTPELAQEIREVIQSPHALDAYWIPRRNWFMGRWIKYCGWYPDYCQPKLFRKNAMRYRDEDIVHEGWDVHGKIGYLKNDVLHFSFQNLSHVINKTNHYSDLGSKKIIRQQKKCSTTLAFLYGLWAFIRIYILKLGFLDGGAGFVIAFSNFEGTFYRYAKAAEQKNQWDKHPK